jgi:hypothetical protein
MKKNWSKVYTQQYACLSKGVKHIGTDGKNWSRDSFMLHPFGVVGITEWDYGRPDGQHIQTEFQTVLEGRRYRMTINEVDMSDRSLKTRAGKFLREALQKLNS